MVGIMYIKFILLTGILTINICDIEGKYYGFRDKIPSNVPGILNPGDFKQSQKRAKSNIPHQTSSSGDTKVSRPTVNVTIFENSAINTLVIRMNVSETSSVFGPGAHLLYSLTPSKGPFVINSANGNVYTTQVLDREVRDMYTYVVTARNLHSGKSYTQNLDIFVLDVNDNAPIFSEPTSIVSVMENVPVGTLVTKMNAFDSDSGQNAVLMYQIINASPSDGSFRIDPYQGTIFIVKSLQHKVTQKYTLTIRVEDQPMFGVRHSSTAMCIINVRRINYNSPVFQGTPYNISVTEESAIGSVVFRVHASDRDYENKVTYSTLSTIFSVDAVSGVVTLRRRLDRETSSLYDFLIMATDNGDPPRSASTSLKVFVLDVNDNSPQFLRDSYIGYISASDAIGHVVVRVSAVDADMGVNQEIGYTLHPNFNTSSTTTHYQDFSIDGSTGFVFLQRALSVTNTLPASYHYTVIATDHGIPPRSSTTSLTIFVRDQGTPVDQQFG